jgi:predicted metal-binding transcription factor (methanogenesis marker protein 9)
MTKPMVTEHNVNADTLVTREMNNEEFAEWEEKLVKRQAIESAEAKAAADKAAVLAKLGISAEEAALLLR